MAKQVGRRANLFPQVEGNVAVFDHVLDLPLHGDEQQHAEVEQQDRPENWNVKHREKRGEKPKRKAFCR